MLKSLVTLILVAGVSTSNVLIFAMQKGEK